MAILTGDKVKLDNGQTITPKQGEWYDGQQYWGGTLSAKGVINSLSDQVGAGEKVSSEVNRQSDVAQGLAPGTIDKYVGNTTPVKNAAKNTVTGGGGSSTLSGGSATIGGAKATLNLQEEYDKLTKELGVDSIKQSITAKQQEIDARKQRLEDAKALINENPLYAEATRTGKIRRLEEQASGDIQNIENEKITLQNTLNEANQTIATRTGLAKDQYTIDRQATQDAVSELNALLTSKANLSGINIQEFASKTGMSTETISALVQASQAKEIDPSVIQSTDDSGNVTVTIIDQKTGAIVGQQKLGRIGKADSTGTGKATEAEISRYYLDGLRQDVASGAGVKDIFKLYAGYVDANQIISIYNANSPNGVAKESPEELAAYGVKY